MGSRPRHILRTDTYVPNTIGQSRLEHFLAENSSAEVLPPLGTNHFLISDKVDADWE